MQTIEADYLVVGAGAMGMAFVDTLITETDAIHRARSSSSANSPRPRASATGPSAAACARHGGAP